MTNVIRASPRERGGARKVSTAYVVSSRRRERAIIVVV